MKLIKEYKFLNNVLGLLVFIFASIVYLMTIEPTTSWWDCGEYIATSYKLQVGHPPGAPFFQLMGRFFSLFAFGDVMQVAKMVNAMSAILSGLTILFTFWTITAIARKFFVKNGEMTLGEKIAVLGAGLVGAATLTFSDSFWFSAVEGEVYATSATFTAAVVWAMMKWEAVADTRYHLRWIVLIAFLMGLSVGVHLLNLLTIPALTYVYYFKKFKPSTKGFIFTGIISLALLGFVQAGVIPWVVKLASGFELFFVNSVGMPFNSGTIIYFVLILGLIVFGLWITRKKGKVVLNTAILAVSFILIGYSTFFMLVIRANANTPINENAPKDAISLLGYLNRDQYGDWPVLYGQFYNAKIKEVEEGDNVYRKGQENGKDKYVVIYKKPKYVYDPNFCGLFPRMWSDQTKHVNVYKEWTGIRNNRKPNFSENLGFLFKNQMGNQYFRYFMWNFVGRQNDVQGFGLDGKGNWDVQNGNWLSGIDFIDEARLGNQDKVPERMQTNKARNTFFFLPLLLGLFGMVFHFWKKPKDAFVVALLFVMTGMAIIIYLNPTPLQPRERDYAYAGSFYAFAIWVGIGVLGVYNLLKKFTPQTVGASLATVICVLAVPTMMGAKGWDDHDRSDKYACRDFARNYLNSCAPNAILITNGDNDTFPLWYAQEVEGIRTDVRVVNFTLASGDWYIHQLYNKLYDSDPLPFTLNSEKYNQGINDWVPVDLSESAPIMNLKDVITSIQADKDATKRQLTNGEFVSYIPTGKLFIPVDSLKVIKNGTVPIHMANRIEKNVAWQVQKERLMKNDLMLLDFLATNNWDRPIYFASPSSVSDFLNIEDYCYLEGSVFRFIPVRNVGSKGGSILTDRSYDLYMKDFAYGNIADPTVYCDKESYQMSLFARNNFARVAQALLAEGKKKQALDCLKKGLEVFPDEQVPYDYYMLGYAELLIQSGDAKAGQALLERIADIYEEDFYYYVSLDRKRSSALKEDSQQAAEVLQYIIAIAERNKLDDLKKKIEAKLQPIAKN